MNKFTSTLAGLALVAGASIAPAFAQDNGGNLFAPPGTFSFVTNSTGMLTASGSGETFNTLTGPTASFAPVSFTLTGQLVAGTIFNLTSFNVTSNGTTVDSLDGNSGLLFVASSAPGGGQFLSSIGASRGGTTFNLVNAPVPEASTTVSFGVLLALGGLAVVLRRKGVKNAA